MFQHETQKEPGHAIEGLETTPVQIRAARLEDVKDVARLAQKLEEELRKGEARRKYTTKELERIYTERIITPTEPELDKKFGVFVAEDQEKIVGFVMGKIEMRDIPRKFSLLQGIYVISDYRRTDVAENLVHEFVRFSQTHGISEIHAEVIRESAGERFFSSRLHWTEQQSADFPPHRRRLVRF